MDKLAISRAPYETMFSLCSRQVISLYKSRSPVNQSNLDTICHFLTSAVYKNQTTVGVMDFQNLAPVTLAWWIDGFMTTVITSITIILNTISIIIFTSSSLRSPTNTILAMISALDVLTCVLRAPLLIYVYLYEGYKVLPSLAWCKEYNYLHNFVPSALHSTAFLLNMGLSVQRMVGVRDIRRLRPICSYKGTVAIALVSFCVSALIHSLYPITYDVTPVVALGKQMLESGKLQEVETCKVSARYPGRFETLSTSYAWARISALQLLPGIVMCVCNISLIAISYKTYNYRRKLIGAIGTIMNVNRGFEGDGEQHNLDNNNQVKNHEEQQRKFSGDYGSKISVVDCELKFNFQADENLLLSEKGDNSEIIVSKDVDANECVGSFPAKASCVTSEYETNGIQCYKMDTSDDIINDEDESDISDKNINEVNDIQGLELLTVVQGDARFTSDSNPMILINDCSDNNVMGNKPYVDIDNTNNTNNNNKDFSEDIHVLESPETVDLNDNITSTPSVQNEDQKGVLSPNFQIQLSSDTITESNTTLYHNGLYKNMLDPDNQLLLKSHVLENVEKLIDNENQDFNSSSDNSLHSNCKNGTQSSSPLRTDNCCDTQIPIPLKELILHRSGKHHKHYDTLEVPSPDTREVSFLCSADPPTPRKGSDVSSTMSSTAIEDTIISETVTDNTYSYTPAAKSKSKPKWSPKRRRPQQEGSTAELRPTIMLVLVTSCTLLAELMVTAALFINFMNQVVYSQFVQEDTLISFILVSNLITMISFPVNFMFFCGLSRPFRNTLVVYGHLVMRKFGRKCK